MLKDYDIQLGGSKMTSQEFEKLANEEMVGGTAHRYNAKTIEYGSYLYSNAKEDMKAFKRYYEKQGYKVLCSDRNRKMQTEGGEYTAELITNQVVSL